MIDHISFIALEMDSQCCCMHCITGILCISANVVVYLGISCMLSKINVILCSGYIVHCILLVSFKNRRPVSPNTQSNTRCVYPVVEFLWDLQDQSVPLMSSLQLVPQDLQLTQKLLDLDAARMLSPHQTVTLLDGNKHSY